MPPDPLVSRRLLRRLLPCLVLALSLAPVTGGRADAAEITVVIGSAEPGRDWGTSYGGILTITLFNIVGAELEGIWQGGELAETSIFTLSAKAYVGPTLGAVVPYIGLAAGVYRESLPGVSDQGTLGAFFLGAKLKFPLGLVLRGEYQWVELPSEVALPMDTRYFFGVGLSF